MMESEDVGGRRSGGGGSGEEWGWRDKVGWGGG